MTSPDVLDFEQLLEPFPGDCPTGVDPRRDSSPYPEFHVIRDERSKARRAERDAEAADDDMLAADSGTAWATVIDKAKGVLIRQGKDLEVVGYLTEALLRRYGFAGLRDGLRLATGYVDTFWDDLYPAAEDETEDTIETRVKPLADLNGADAMGTLIEPLRKVALTGSDDPGPFALWQYENATTVRHDPAYLEQIKSCVRATPVPFYRDLIDDLDACTAAWQDLTDLLGTKCGEKAPPSSAVRNTLEEIRDAVRYFTGDIPPLRALWDTPEAATGGDAQQGIIDVTANLGQAAGGAVGVAVDPGAIRSREEALNALLKIAEYFRQSEPHSLMAWSLEELVRRGRLPLIELLKELIPNDESRNDLLTRAGIVPPETTEASDGN